MQTAMQKLISQIKEEMTIDTIPKEWYYCLKSVVMSIEATYLEMEKQQIIDAWENGEKSEYLYLKNQRIGSSEEYYNETYGSKGSDETNGNSLEKVPNGSILKGHLKSKSKGWFIAYNIDAFEGEFPIHPKYEKYYFLDEEDEGKEVEFEIIKYDGTTEISEGWGGYAKLTSKIIQNHIVDTNEMISIADKTRYQKLETIAKLLAKSWFYGDWKWESPNERVQQMLMQELGYYPFKDEDEMIYHTKVDENLYKQAANEIKGWSELPKDISISSQTEISDEEINKKAMDILKDRWSHLYLDGYPKKPFPINYQHDLDIVMLGIYKSQQLSDKKPMRFHCVPKEISDEEIEELANEFSLKYYTRGVTEDEVSAFVTGMKKYREQLKKKNL